MLYSLFKRQECESLSPCAAPLTKHQRVLICEFHARMFFCESKKRTCQRKSIDRKAAFEFDYQTKMTDILDCIVVGGLSVTTSTLPTSLSIRTPIRYTSTSEETCRKSNFPKVCYRNWCLESVQTRLFGSVAQRTKCNLCEFSIMLWLTYACNTAARSRPHFTKQKKVYSRLKMCSL